MAYGTILSQDNLRSYILSALQRIYRDLETVSSSTDRNITEHVLYRLEHVIVLILQCQVLLRPPPPPPPSNQKYRHDQKCRLLLSPQPIQIVTQSVQVNIIPWTSPTKSAVNQTAPIKSAHPLSQIATTIARLIPQRAFRLPQLRLLMPWNQLLPPKTYRPILSSTWLDRPV